LSLFSGVVAKATVVLILLNITSKLTAVLREALFASHFGATWVADAYFFAFTFPSVLFYLFAGALTTVVVPIYSEYAAQGREREAWGLFGTLFAIITFLLLLITALGIVFAPKIVGLFAPEFQGATRDMAVYLTQLMFPFLIFSGLAALFSGLLNARNVFAITALNGPLGNLAVIGALVFLAAQWGIAGIAVAVVVGGMAGALVQVPHLIRAGFRFFPGVPLSHPDLKRILILVLPITLSYSISETYIIIDRYLASGLADGSIASLNYANKLIQVPLGLFVIAVGTAVYPTLTRLATAGDFGQLGETVQRAFRLVMLICIPAAVSLLVLREPLVTLFYKRNEFGEYALLMTVIPLFYYSFGLIGQAGEFILVRGFFAMQNTRTPLYLSGFSVLVNLGLCLALVGPMKHGGLALGNALAALLNMTLLFYFLHRRLGNLWTPYMRRFIPITLTAAGIMGVTMRLIAENWGLLAAPVPTFALAAQVIIVGLGGCGLFLGILALLKIEETREMGEALRKLRAKG